MAEGKKISFGFSKSLKKPDLKRNVPKEEKKIEYIECINDNSIKIIGKEEEKKDEPLVIPMLGSKSWHDRIINQIDVDIYGQKEKQKNNEKKLEDTKIKVEPEDLDDNNPSPEGNDKKLTLDELAAKEILNDLKEDVKSEKADNNLVINGKNKIDENLLGQKEPTLEDYESIPIDQFGLAMLRGMGWKPDVGLGKTAQVVKPITPDLRPKGMGLGADKMLLKKLNVIPKTKEEADLKIQVGAFIKIIAGSHNGNYGRIEGLDEESGRLIVKLALNNQLVNLNESLVVLVTKTDFDKNSKVLNVNKYEKYKNTVTQGLPAERKSEANNKNDEITLSSDSETDNQKNKKSKSHRHRDSSDERSRRRKSKKKSKSSDRRRGRSRSTSKSRNRNDHYHSRDKKKSKKHKRSRSRSRSRSRGRR